jgi:hypothetical protein
MKSYIKEIDRLNILPNSVAIDCLKRGIDPLLVVHYIRRALPGSIAGYVLRAVDADTQGWINVSFTETNGWGIKKLCWSSDTCTQVNPDDIAALEAITSAA